MFAGQPGQAPVGVVYGVLAWSPDARNWHYIAPEQSFVPLGSSGSGTSGTGGGAGAGAFTGAVHSSVRASRSSSISRTHRGSSSTASAAAGAGDFDCCGVFMAKQNPAETPQFSASDPNTPLPLYYAGSNGAFFGPRAGSLGVASVGKHAFAGYVGPATITTAWSPVQTGSLKVTAVGAVRVGVQINSVLTVESCNPVNGTEVAVKWATNTTAAGQPAPAEGNGGTDAAAAAAAVGWGRSRSSSRSRSKPPVDPAYPIAEYVGGAVGLVFDVPAGSILYAYHM